MTAADGSGREATARSIIDIGWLGGRLVRTDNADAAPYAVGLCLLVVNTSHECEHDVARDPAHDLFHPAFSPDGRFAAVVQAPDTEIGFGPIVVYDAATGAPVRTLTNGQDAAVVVARRPVHRLRSRQRHLRACRPRGGHARAACSRAASSPSGSALRRAASAAIRPCA